MSLRCRVSPDRPCWFADFDPEAQVTESEIAEMHGGGFRFLHFGESFMIRATPAGRERLPQPKSQRIQTKPRDRAEHFCFRKFRSLLQAALVATELSSPAIGSPSCNRTSVNSSPPTR